MTMDIYSRQAQLDAIRLRLRYFETLNVKAEIESLKKLLKQLSGNTRG